MNDQVAVFLRSEAQRHGYTVFDALVGEIELGHSAAMRQLCGSVYGVWADTSVRPAPEGVGVLPGNPDWFPVYWGRDIKPCSRILAHIQNHEGTGNANLKSIDEIIDRKLIFGAIMVSKYKEFELYLHEFYKPLRGTERGASSLL